MYIRLATIARALRVNDTDNHVPAPASADSRPATPAQPDSPITVPGTAAEPPWCAITALADAVFDTLTASNWNGGTQQTSVPLPAGTTIYGNFTQFQLASGDIIAYCAR
ncbi:MAG TPA: hypothetical protein VHC95_07095 [Opitutales bacterium]|nr:hypothetical protein [Opitutales bacterium]